MKRSFFSTISGYIYTLLVLCMLSCNNPVQTQTGTKIAVELEQPNRRDLYRNLRKKGELTLVYSSEHSPPKELLEKLRVALVNRERTPLQLNWIGDDELTTASLSNGGYFLIGTPVHHHLIAEMASKMPYDYDQACFTFSGKRYAQAQAVFKLDFYPNPINNQFPISILTGNQEEALYQLLEQLYEENPSQWMNTGSGYQIYQEGQIQLKGYFEEQWAIEDRLQYDFSTTRKNEFDQLPFTVMEHETQLAPEALQHLKNRIAKAIQDIEGATGKLLPKKNYTYHIYASIEQKGLLMNNACPAHVDFSRGAVHVVINENFSGEKQQIENQLLIRELLGNASHTALEKGFGLFFTDSWEKKGYAYWAKRLFQSNNLPPLPELFDAELLEKESPLVMGAAAGSMVAFLIDYWGMPVFLDRYKDWVPTPAELASLDKEWRDWLTDQPIAKLLSPQELPYLKGFNFAHEGYRVYNGYGSKEARKSLERLAAIGTSSIAIVPYSYMRSPNNPSFIPIMRRAGSETDESVIATHLDAQRLGMITILKPQIWLGRSWPGDVYMSSEEDWALFFDYYYRWIRHYTLLAEIHNIDVMCLGVEFAKATLNRPDDWRRIFRKMRKLYSGNLTYAANWGEEFEQVSFWEELDFIGIDCYYPLSKSEKVSEKELAKEFERILNKIENVSKRFNKPVLFTEIGFRSVTATWMNPHAEPNGRSTDQSAQEMCYGVVFEAIENKDWCKGLLWWKWPSFLSYNNRRNMDTGFSPSQKSAEDVVSQWFNRLPE